MKKVKALDFFGVGKAKLKVVSFACYLLYMSISKIWQSTMECIEMMKKEGLLIKSSVTKAFQELHTVNEPLPSTFLSFVGN